MTPPLELGTVNGIDTGALQRTIEAIEQDGELGKTTLRASNKWLAANHNCTTVTDFFGAGQEQHHKHSFELHADEPSILAGDDEAANPVEYLLHSLASCMTTSMVAHAAANGIHIDELESELQGDIDLRGYLGLADVPKGYSHIRVRFRVKTPEQDLELLKGFAQFSPVYNTLLAGTDVDVQVQRM
jgi:uncharacterized OsmC-like protein